MIGGFTGFEGSPGCRIFICNNVDVWRCQSFIKATVVAFIVARALKIQHVNKQLAPYLVAVYSNIFIYYDLMNIRISYDLTYLSPVIYVVPKNISFSLYFRSSEKKTKITRWQMTVSLCTISVMAIMLSKYRKS